MDGYSSKRVHVGIVSRKGHGLVLRDSMKHRDQSNQYGNRLGCTGRICSSSCAQVGYSNKSTSKRPFHSSSGKEVVGSSSAIRNLRKSFPEPFGKLSSKLETDSSENDSIHYELKELEFISPPELLHTALHVKSESSVPADAMLMERGSCSTDSNNKAKRNSIQRYEVDNQDSHASMRPRSLCQTSNGGSSWYNLRNLTYDSVSEVTPSDSSLLESNLVRRKNVTKKMLYDGENSSRSRGKKGSGTSRGQKCVHRHRHGISISDQRPEPEGYSHRQHDIGQATPVEAGLSRTSTNINSFRCHNVDGIAEVLLALERIEQEEELTYERAILLETSMFLNSLNIHDQHRDMRLDIDNMTYEQLLDLEERMGTVSTALSEEALTECLNRSIYQSKPKGGTATGAVEDLSDVKCCICQEEYVIGDEVGRLQCEHKYHVACIQKWLRLKNWCPICKSSAAAL